VTTVMFKFKKMCLLSVCQLIEFKEFRDLNYYIWNTILMIIIIIIIIFLHGLGRLTCSGIDACHRFLRRPRFLRLRGLSLRAHFGSLLLSVLVTIPRKIKYS